MEPEVLLGELSNQVFHATGHGLGDGVHLLFPIGMITLLRILVQALAGAAIGYLTVRRRVPLEVGAGLFAVVFLVASVITGSVGLVFYAKGYGSFIYFSTLLLVVVFGYIFGMRVGDEQMEI